MVLLSRTALVLSLPALLLACTPAAAPLPPRAPEPPAPAPVSPPAPEPPRPPSLALVLSPRRATDALVDRVAVSMVFDGAFADDTGGLSLWLADAHEGQGGWASRVRELSATDDDGAVAFSRHGEKRGLVSWTTARPVHGSLRVTFEADARPGARDAVTTGLRGDARAVLGVGASFLPLPRATDVYRLSARWDTTSLGATASGVTSLDGLASGVSAPPGRLRSTVFAAGALETTKAESEGHAITGVWLGDGLPPEATTAWAARALAAEARHFGDSSPEPLVLFHQPSLGPRGLLRGSASPSSFVLQTGGRARLDALARLMIAHELCHRWLGVRLRLAGREGTQAWFSEGLTVHFTREILLAEGMITFDEYATDVGASTVKYFTNPFRTASNAAIADLRDTQATHERLPYDRGSLFAAELDARIRERSAGARTLRDFVRELLDLAASHPVEPDGVHLISSADLREHLARELGDAAVARLDDVTERGSDPEPPSSAFGPCLRRIPRDYRAGNETVHGYAWQRTRHVADAKCASRK
jgi:hypothetical protein